MHINPDHYLTTSLGRIINNERNLDAWKLCFSELKHQLDKNSKLNILYILIGCQGSGKTIWAKAKIQLEPNNLIFDAILVKKNERLRILQMAKEYNIKCVAVWFQTPLNICIQRNSQRRLDERVDSNALKNVFFALDPPCSNEGFNQIITII